MSQNGDMEQDRYKSGQTSVNGERMRGVEEKCNKNDTKIGVLEEQAKHFATKEDLQKLKVWVIVAGVGAILSVFGMILSLIRLIPST